MLGFSSKLGFLKTFRRVTNITYNLSKNRLFTKKSFHVSNVNVINTVCHDIDDI